MKNENNRSPKKILQDAYNLAKENRKIKERDKARMTKGKEIEGQSTPTVNDIIRQIRVSKNLTQKDVADKLSMSQNGYSKIERGFSVMTIGRVKEIAEALDVNYVDILSQVENSNEAENEVSKEEVEKKLESLRLENIRERKKMAKEYTMELRNLKLKISEQSKLLEHKDKVITLLEDKIRLLEKEKG